MIVESRSDVRLLITHSRLAAAVARRQDYRLHFASVFMRLSKRAARDPVSQLIPSRFLSFSYLFQLGIEPGVALIPVIWLSSLSAAQQTWRFPKSEHWCNFLLEVVNWAPYNGQSRHEVRY
jgi:hypothetical protein